VKRFTGRITESENFVMAITVVAERHALPAPYFRVP
jgi:hypothetical protein